MTLATGRSFANRGAKNAIHALVLRRGVGQDRRVRVREPEKRVAFRVAVRRNAGVDAHLLLGDTKVPAAVGDVAAAGMFIKPEGGPLAALRVDSAVDVEVIFDGEKLDMRGVIRSEHDGGYGIFFPPRDRLGRPNPLARFERISACLLRTSSSQRPSVVKRRR